MKYYKLADLSREFNLSEKFISRKLDQYGFKVEFDPVEGNFLIPEPTYKIMKRDIEYFEDDCWTTQEVAELLGTSVATVQRLRAKGYLSCIKCRWRSSQKVRHTQEQIEELLFRLEFADLDWRHEHNLVDVIGSCDREFPGVEEYRKIRKNLGIC